MMRNSLCLAVLAAAALAAQTVETTRVVSRLVDRRSKLPGELLPYQRVAIHARVAGFVESVEVDRASVVKKGQLLAVLAAPEMDAQFAEAQARVQAIEAQRAEAEAKLVAVRSTWDRLKAAAATPGAIAADELVRAEKGVDAARALVKALEDSARAARASSDAIGDLRSYLRIAAPFDGVITARHAHPGALAGPSGGPLLELEDVARLRLVVAVPEAEASGIARGAGVNFTVPAHPGRTFSGAVARITPSLDPKTRSMPVELDVPNTKGLLAPGMYAEVFWTARRPGSALLVPPTAVVTTTERSFVIRLRNGRAEWVNVTRGAPAGDLVEVLGALQAGDEIVRRASDEIREGTALQARAASK